MPPAQPEERILKIIYEYFDLRPSALIKELDLRRPIYKNLAVCVFTTRLQRVQTVDFFTV